MNERLQAYAHNAALPGAVLSVLAIPLFLLTIYALKQVHAQELDRLVSENAQLHRELDELYDALEETLAYGDDAQAKLELCRQERLRGTTP